MRKVSIRKQFFTGFDIIKSRHWLTIFYVSSCKKPISDLYFFVFQHNFENKQLIFDPILTRQKCIHVFNFEKSGRKKISLGMPPVSYQFFLLLKFGTVFLDYHYDEAAFRVNIFFCQMMILAKSRLIETKIQAVFA